LASVKLYPEEFGGPVPPAVSVKPGLVTSALDPSAIIEVVVQSTPLTAKLPICVLSVPLY